MAEYITKKQVIEWFRCYAYEDRPIGFDDLEFNIQHTIPEDVSPVRHGRWIMRGGKRYCSECGNRACVTRDSDDFWYTVGTDFCPNCGAKMDLEV